MPEGRFKPPAAEVRDPPPGRGSALKGLVLGFVIDVAGTLLFSIVLGAFYAMVLAGAGHSEAEIRVALEGAGSNAWIEAIGVVAGSALSVLGGYVCERIARRGDYRLGLVLAGIGAGFGLLVAEASTPLAQHALMIFLTFGSVLLGTRLAIERQRR